MTTSKKLWLGFGTLTALLMLFSATIILRLMSIESNVAAQANVARPRSATARELEINVLEYALGVQEHLFGGAPSPGQEAAKDAGDVDRQLAEYRRLAQSDRQRELTVIFLAQWREFQALGQALLDAGQRPPKPEDAARFQRLRVELEKFLDDEMQLDAMAAYDARRKATVQDVQAAEGFALLLLVAGSLIAIATSVIVGRGVVRAEQALGRANDELEERVQERTVRLATANESLVRSNRELEQFASVASHDLQEPLRKIQAFGDRLQIKCAADLSEQGREYLERMLSSAARMRLLIDDLLSFSRVTTKGQPFVAVDLAATAREVLSDLEERVLRSGGRVEVGELPTVQADPSQMRQLFQNLLANGLKFHRPGESPLVRIESQLVNHAGDNGQGGPRCEIAVRDSGIGFEEIYLDRIFELFQRLHGRQQYEGTGMGLAICRKIVERHGGTITATSAPGQGATFLVTLPVVQP